MQMSLTFSNVGTSEVLPDLDRAFKRGISVMRARCRASMLYIFLHDGGAQLRRARDSARRFSPHPTVTTAPLYGSASAGGSRPQVPALVYWARSGTLLLHMRLHDGPTLLRRTRASVERISLHLVVSAAAPDGSASAGGRCRQAPTLCTAGPDVERHLATCACTTGPHSYRVCMRP